MSETPAPHDEWEEALDEVREWTADGSEGARLAAIWRTRALAAGFVMPTDSTYGMTFERVETDWADLYIVAKTLGFDGVSEIAQGLADAEPWYAAALRRLCELSASSRGGQPFHAIPPDTMLHVLVIARGEVPQMWFRGLGRPGGMFAPEIFLALKEVIAENYPAV